MIAALASSFPRLPVALLAVLVLVATACGVPTDSEPMEIADDQLTELLGVEYGGLEVAPTALAVNFPNDEGTNVYFIGEENRLVAVRRSVDSDTASLVLQRLLEGPTEAEREVLGYSTAIDADLRVLGVDTLNATVIVDIAGGSTLETLTGDEAKLAFAQMVYTLTELSPIASFLLRIDGERIGLPTDAGVNDPQDPVFRSNFSGCCAPPFRATPTPRPEIDAPVRNTPTPLAPTATPAPAPTPTVGAATPLPTPDS